MCLVKCLGPKHNFYSVAYGYLRFWSKYETREFALISFSRDKGTQNAVKTHENLESF